MGSDLRVVLDYTYAVSGEPGVGCVFRAGMTIHSWCKEIFDGYYRGKIVQGRGRL